MRYFLDTEFIEDGSTIDLISVGIASEDGRYYYAVSSEYDRAKAEAHPFVSDYVLPGLAGSTPVPRDAILDGILSFIGDDPKPEFWGDYCSYDWVALCQLFGTMQDLPHSFPKFCNDLQNLRLLFGIPCEKLPVIVNTPHNAIIDAVQAKMLFHYMRTYINQNYPGQFEGLL